jgi:hypothetical protein
MLVGPNHVLTATFCRIPLSRLIEFPKLDRSIQEKSPHSGLGNCGGQSHDGEPLDCKEEGSLGLAWVEAFKRSWSLP